MILATACSQGVDSKAGDDMLGASTDEIVDVNHSAVKRQSIGNCWIYATASWAESLNKTATGTELNMSESYWTYWHWFEQIANSRASEIQTGGYFSVAINLIDRYGVMNEADFIPEESTVEMSLRQKSALATMNESLKSGALKEMSARRERALVRSELDRAWALSAEVIAELDSAFGTSVNRTVDRTADLTGTKITASKDIPVTLVDPETHAPVDATLSDAIGTSSGFRGRTGRLAWKSVNYGWSAASRRTFQKRVQRAMADKQPVVMSWFVDFNALDAQGRFMAPPATPGHQGGHMVVVEDYEIDNVPGFGTLPAGTVETRADALAASLADEAEIKFIRIKNSWGTARADRGFSIPGYHDLYMKYLDGPVSQCQAKPDGSPDTDNCWDTTPLNEAILPAGY